MRSAIRVLIKGSGLRDSDGEVHFAPRLPAEWDGLRFRVQVRGQLIEVEMTHEGTAYTLLEGTGLLIHEHGEAIRLLPEPAGMLAAA